MKIISIKDFDNIRIGNAQNTSSGTGCTVIISETGMCAGLDVRGGGPASRESELLKPLAAAGGVMQFLEEKGIGLDVGIAKVPLVCQSDIFDLTVADPYTRPDKAMGYEACVGAWQNNYQDGCFGVGTGATIGKLNGMDFCMKSGIGSYAVQIGELKIGAIVAVNALGDIYDHHNGQIIAGMLSDDQKSFADSAQFLYRSYDIHENTMAMHVRSVLCIPQLTETVFTHFLSETYLLTVIWSEHLLQMLWQKQFSLQSEIPNQLMVFLLIKISVSYKIF